jgi:hypothetical protein
MRRLDVPASLNCVEVVRRSGVARVSKNIFAARVERWTSKAQR